MNTHDITLNEFKKRQEQLGEYANGIMIRNIGVLQDMAWRSINITEFESHDIVIFCVETASARLTEFATSFIKEGGFQFDPEIKPNGITSIVTTHNACLGLAKLFPYSAKILQTPTNDGKVKVVILTEYGLTVYKIFPKAAPDIH